MFWFCFSLGLVLFCFVLFLFCLVSCTALFIYTKMFQELDCLEMVVTAPTEMVLTALGTVLSEVQFVHKRWRPLMKCTDFDIAENLSESLFLIRIDIHSLTSLIKKMKSLSPGEVNGAVTTDRC